VRLGYPDREERMSETVPEVGQMIRYVTATAKRGFLERVEREGRVECVWGNGWDGPHITTDTGTCIPSLGDTWVVVTSDR
jgi:hypothetical protein